MHRLHGDDPTPDVLAWELARLHWRRSRKRRCLSCMRTSPVTKESEPQVEPKRGPSGALVGKDAPPAPPHRGSSSISHRLPRRNEGVA